MGGLKRTVVSKTALSAFLTATILAVLVLLGPAPNQTLASRSIFGIIGSELRYQYGYGGGGGGGGGGLPGLPPGGTDVGGITTSEGRFTTRATPVSDDGRCRLNIPSGTIGLTKDLEPLSRITIQPMVSPPAPPAGANVVGLPFDLGPSGAVFDPPITVTFTYDPTRIPAGVAEEDLVIAVWDGSKWVELTNITVDPVTNTISGRTSHFSAFARNDSPAGPGTGTSATTGTNTSTDATSGTGSYACSSTNAGTGPSTSASTDAANANADAASTGTINQLANNRSLDCRSPGGSRGARVLPVVEETFSLTTEASW